MAGAEVSPVTVNALSHHSESNSHIDAGTAVKLLYLLPYSLDWNLIQETLAKLKGFVKHQ
jgi:hypothetical protein